MQVTTLAEELAASKRTVEDLRAQVAHAAAPHAPGAVATLLDVVHSAVEEEAKARAVLVDQLAVKEVRYLLVVGLFFIVPFAALRPLFISFTGALNRVEKGGLYTKDEGWLVDNSITHHDNGVLARGPLALCLMRRRCAGGPSRS